MSDLSETFPMDFAGAVKSYGEPAIICISSDEEDTEKLSTCSVDDLYLSSEDETEEVRLMAKCIEWQLTEPIAIPTTAACSLQKRPETPRPNMPPFPTFGEKYFDLALGNGAISTAISERVIPEIQNIVSSMSSSGNRDNRPACPLVVRKIGKIHPG